MNILNGGNILAFVNFVNRMDDSMFKIESGTFVYSDELRRMGECKFDVLFADDEIKVIFTELISNKGPSITNAMEHLISQFCHRLQHIYRDYNFEDVVFYERYQTHPEFLDKVVTNPKLIWERLSSNESKAINALI